ncbi:hypothetical protein RJ639_047266 [Escallonia herrerae]|uniref:Uncharacterized protein n=1 Tax=Escallonia herrerae TaxID=1293975 RepID=A0AA88WEX6_9ASTE|nr:hypothetical protein RJ639_047266 [Escallonia herrerae]
MEKSVEEGWSLEQCVSYVLLLREKFHAQSDRYHGFTTLLTDFIGRRVNACRLSSKFKELFNGHKDLILGFNAFLPRNLQNAVTDAEDDDAVRSSTPAKANKRDDRAIEAAVEFVNKVRKRFATDDLAFKAFLDTMARYQRRHLSDDQVDQEFRVFFRGDPDLYIDFTRFLADSVEKKRGSTQTSWDSTGWAKRGGGTYTSNVNKRKKTFIEKTQDACEDKKYEVDVVVELLRSTANKAKDYIDQKPERESFSVLNLRCIERLYGEHGSEVVDRLLQNSACRMPIVHRRLCQKLKDAEAYGEEVNADCKKTFADMRRGGKRGDRCSKEVDAVRKETSADMQHGDRGDQCSDGSSAKATVTEADETSVRKESEDIREEDRMDVD